MSNPNVIVAELDRLYEFEIDKYVEECNQLKRIGYKIYRNDDGKHKVVEPARPNDMFGDNDIYNAFGGIFGNIFRGGKG